MGERRRAYGACLTRWDSCLDAFWPSLLIYGEQMKVDKQWVILLWKVDIDVLDDSASPHDCLMSKTSVGHSKRVQTTPKRRVATRRGKRPPRIIPFAKARITPCVPANCPDNIFDHSVSPRPCSTPPLSSMVPSYRFQPMIPVYFPPWHLWHFFSELPLLGRP